MGGTASVGPIYRPDGASANRGWHRPWRRRPAGTGTRSYVGPPRSSSAIWSLRADGSLGRVLETIARTDVLVVDDFAMATLNEQERRDFLEICDDRYNRRSTIVTSQLPVASWHQQIGDPTVADSILDRLVHNAYRIELSGESMRKKKGRGLSEDRPGGCA